jgi:hypothetical protein
MGGVEVLRARMPGEQALGLVQQVGRRLQQRECRLGRRHAGAGAHEQRIAGELAQAAQLRAHRRLRAVQPQGCARNAAFVDHGVQDPHEMELDLVEFLAARHSALNIVIMNICVYR